LRLKVTGVSTGKEIAILDSWEKNQPAMFLVEEDDKSFEEFIPGQYYKA
jgi:hypothetical protein